MAALPINDYAGLVAAVQAWADRAGDADFVAQADNFILLATAEFNLSLNPHQQEATASITTDASGVGTLPANFATAVSLTYPPYGTLKQTSLDGINFLNPAAVSGIPYNFAISGPSLILDRASAVTLELTYVAGFAALSSTNTNNWLLTKAPHAYLFMAMAMGEAFNSNWSAAAGLEAKANAILEQVVAEGQLAQFGRAEMTLRGIAP
jgi:hypothetical protein